MMIIYPFGMLFVGHSSFSHREPEDPILNQEPWEPWLRWPSVNECLQLVEISH